MYRVTYFLFMNPGQSKNRKPAYLPPVVLIFSSDPFMKNVRKLNLGNIDSLDFETHPFMPITLWPRISVLFLY